jgi:hypothetical protein
MVPALAELLLMVETLTGVMASLAILPSRMKRTTI